MPDSKNFSKMGGMDMESGSNRAVDVPYMTRLKETVTVFAPLGLVAFGGPQAHIAILREHLVVNNNWLDEDEFMELFAIGQGLPGPTSTQLVVSCATSRAGMLGGILALLMWNLPGFVVCTVCSVLAKEFVTGEEKWLAGFAPAAIALLFSAAYGFTGKLDNLGKPMALVSCVVAVLIAGDNNIDKTVCQWVYPLLLIGGCLFTLIDSKRENPFGDYGKAQKGWDATSDQTMKRIGIPLSLGVFFFGAWVAVLIGGILIRSSTRNDTGLFPLFESMYRTGSIIFGGGQVVLPMLYNEVVDPVGGNAAGWISSSSFYQGFALAQSLPGPLFNFAAFVGGAYQVSRKNDRKPHTHVGVAACFEPHVARFWPLCGAFRALNGAF